MLIKNRSHCFWLTLVFLLLFNSVIHAPAGNDNFNFNEIINEIKSLLTQIEETLAEKQKKAEDYRKEASGQLLPQALAPVPTGPASAGSPLPPVPPPKSS